MSFAARKLSYVVDDYNSDLFTEIINENDFSYFGPQGIKIEDGSIENLRLSTIWQSPRSSFSSLPPEFAFRPSIDQLNVNAYSFGLNNPQALPPTDGTGTSSATPSPAPSAASNENINTGYRSSFSMLQNLPEQITSSPIFASFSAITNICRTQMSFAQYFASNPNALSPIAFIDFFNLIGQSIIQLLRIKPEGIPLELLRSQLEEIFNSRLPRSKDTSLSPSFCFSEKTPPSVATNSGIGTAQLHSDNERRESSSSSVDGGNANNVMNHRNVSSDSLMTDSASRGVNNPHTMNASSSSSSSSSTTSGLSPSNATFGIPLFNGAQKTVPPKGALAISGAKINNITSSSSSLAVNPPQMGKTTAGNYNTKILKANLIATASSSSSSLLSSLPSSSLLDPSSLDALKQIPPLTLTSLANSNNTSSKTENDLLTLNSEVLPHAKTSLVSLRSNDNLFSSPATTSNLHSSINYHTQRRSNLTSSQESSLFGPNILCSSSLSSDPSTVSFVKSNQNLFKQPRAACSLHVTPILGRALPLLSPAATVIALPPDPSQSLPLNSSTMLSSSGQAVSQSPSLSYHPPDIKFPQLSGESLIIKATGCPPFSPPPLISTQSRTSDGDDEEDQDQDQDQEPLAESSGQPNADQKALTFHPSNFFDNFNEPFYLHLSADDSNQSTGNWQKRKRKRISCRQNLLCHICQETETPEWRKGPDGNHTLCNACGLNYAKKIKNERSVLEKMGHRRGSIDNILDTKKFDLSLQIASERAKKEKQSPPMSTQINETVLSLGPSTMTEFKLPTTGASLPASPRSLPPAPVLSSSSSVQPQVDLSSAAVLDHHHHHFSQPKTFHYSHMS